MNTNNQVTQFLSNYDEKVINHAMLLREIILSNLPDIIEQVDLPAKMIMYCYGQTYAELICNIMPSKKGIKLGFNRGIYLNDPDHILQGNGKISRYIEIKSKEMIQSDSIKIVIKQGLMLYHERMKLKAISSRKK